MNADDVDRELKLALRSVRDAYHPAQQRRKAAARSRLVERYQRRRWLVPVVSVGVAGAVAIAGVLTFNALSPDAARREPRRQELPAVEGLIARIQVGKGPADIGVSRRGVWVVGRDAGTLSRIDPATNSVAETETTGGSPVEVDAGGGFIWVADVATGEITKRHPKTGDAVAEPVRIAAPGGGLALAVGTDVVWAVAQGEALFSIDFQTLETTQVLQGAVTDVAARGDTVWLLDRERGLVRFDALSGAIEKNPGITVEDSDLYAGESALWIANHQVNQLLRVDPSTLSVLATPRLLGDYVDMALTPEAAWILSGDGEVRLEALAANGSPLREPIELGGDPVEVSTGHGAIWVADDATDQILRLEP